MKLKGTFWKPGVNGLGIRGFHLLPYRKRFDEAARKHDADYDIRGDWKWRRRYDIRFLISMTMKCDNDLQVMFAVLYYITVRLFGWAFYRYDR